MNTDSRTAQKTLSDIRKRLNDAKVKNDFATSGSLQKDLVDAQTNVAQINAQQQETRDTLTTYKNLATIADERIKAIEENREALISGLKVVDIPGIDSLGILQGGSSKPGGTSIYQLPPSL